MTEKLPNLEGELTPAERERAEAFAREFQAHEREIMGSASRFSGFAKKIVGILPTKQVALLMLYYGLKAAAPDIAQAGDGQQPAPRKVSDIDYFTGSGSVFNESGTPENIKPLTDVKGNVVGEIIHVDTPEERATKNKLPKQKSPEELAAELFETTAGQAEEIKEAKNGPKTFEEVRVAPEEATGNGKN